MAASSSLETKNRYAICVGINRYDAQDQILPLQFAEQDAKDVYVLLLAHGFDSEHSYLLLGESATWEAMHHALTTLLLTKARKDDLVIFYFAGHSIPISINDDDEDEEQEPQSDVFLCSTNFDLQKMVDERGAWLGYPLRMQKLRTDIFELAASRKVLFIFDSCHSGDFFGKHYRPRTSENLATRYIEQPFGKNSSGRIVLSSCLPHQTSRENDQLEHGVFTYHLLEGLSGKDRQAVSRSHEGWVTVGSLFDYLAHKMPGNQRPVKSGAEHDAFKLVYYRQYVEQASTQNIQSQEDSLPPHKSLEKERRLKAMLADHTGFMRDRLESFVGRQIELSEIKQRIAEKLQTGGYVTITGQAGQGKSSIIAKLVEGFGVENVAFHFIPFNPGPDHQVGLLRNVMARLILKHDLPELYVASESRPVLRDYFPKVLGELVAKGGQEVIFIDGLDQLEEDFSDVRDLSFLPNNPPIGVVFVLGTRPNDTLRPLELLKPRHEYNLPNLSRSDFDLLLRHRKVHLSSWLTDNFYKAMQENALYLDLVAKELTEADTVSHIEAIKRIAHNPNNIFSLSIDRFKRQEKQWRTVLKPILGLLLASNEPLKVKHIRQILALEDDEVWDGLRRLGGLLAEDGQGRRYLFHLKLQEYLRQDENNTNKEYIFAIDEEIWWHKKLVSWCEQNGLEKIWLDVKLDADEHGRRLYARKHYIYHLAQSKSWGKLREVLDEGSYGQAKLRDDPSTRSFAQDLYIGRQAAVRDKETMEERLAHLKYLWRYTLLQCSLTSRADSYTLEAFEALVLLRREQEAIGLAELLTKPNYKVRVLHQIARNLKEQQGREQESFQLLMRAFELVKFVKDSHEKAEILSLLGLDLAEIQQWEEAKLVWEQAKVEANEINQPYKRFKSLQELARVLIKYQQLDEAETVACMIDDNDKKVEILLELFKALIQAQDLDKAEITAQMIDIGYIRVKVLQELVYAFIDVQRLDKANAIAQMIDVNDVKAKVLLDLANALIQNQQWKQTEIIIEMMNENWARANRAKIVKELLLALIQFHQWERAVALARKVGNSLASADKIEVLRELTIALIQAQQWNQAEVIIYLIDEKQLKAEMLQELLLALSQFHQWKQAETVIHKIPEDNDRVKVMLWLGLKLTEAQQWGKAQAVLNEIEKIIRALKNDEEKVQGLQELAIVLTKAQQWEKAQIVWNKVEKMIQVLKYGEEKEQALRELAIALTKAQWWEKARAVWAEADVIEADFTWTSDNEVKKAEMMQELAFSLIETQQWNTAHAFAFEIDLLWVRVSVLEDLAIALTRAQQWQTAQAIWIEAIDTVHTIDDVETLALTLQDLVRTLIEAQQWERAEAIWHEVNTMAYFDEFNEDEVNRELTEELIAGLVKAQQWNRAEAIIRAIESSQFKVKAWQELARKLTEAQELERSKSAWIEAQIEEAVCIIEDSDFQDEFDGSLWDRSQTLQELAKALMKVQLWEKAKKVWSEAEETVSKIGESEVRWEAMLELVRALIEAQQWEHARVIASGIKDIWDTKRSVALGELATALASVQQWELAEEIARMIEEPKEKVEVMQELATALTKAQQCEQAEVVWCETEETVQKIGPFEVKSGLYLSLGNALAMVQRWNKAKEIWTKVLPFTRIKENYTARDEALRELCVALAKAKLWDEAKTVAFSITKSKEKAVALTELCIALAKVKLWTEAKAMALSITESKEKATALLRLGIELDHSHKEDQALAIWTLVLDLANTIQDSEAKDEVLSELSLVLIKAGQWEQVEIVANMIKDNGIQVIALLRRSCELGKVQQWERAEIVVSMIKDNWAKATSLIRLGTELASSKQWEKAKLMWIQAEEAAHTIEWNWAKCKALRELGAELVKAQHREWAVAIWAKAENAAHSIQGNRARAEALAELSLEYAKVSLWKQSQKIWKQAEEIAHTIQASDERAETLLALGVELARLQKWERAQKIWADAEIATRTLEDGMVKASLLLRLGKSLAHIEQQEQAKSLWLQAESVTYHSIANIKDIVKMLKTIATILAEAEEYELLLRLVQRSWLLADTREIAIRLLPLAYSFIPLKPDLGIALYKAFDWVEAFLNG